jgi:electron transport complex protein RnfE
VPAFFDGIGRGAGFLVALVVISAFRELLGKGALLGIPVLGGAKPLLIMVLPAGGFLAVGLLMALFNWVDTKFLKKES